MKTSLKKHLATLLLLATIHIPLFAEEDQQVSVSYWSYILPFILVVTLIGLTWLSSREKPGNKRRLR